VSNRATGGRFRTILAMLTIATLLAMPFSAFGAKGSASKVVLTVNPLIQAVSPNGLTGFEVYFESLQGTLTNLTFTGEFSAGVTVPNTTGTPCPGTAAPATISESIGNMPAGQPYEFDTGLVCAGETDVVFRATFTADAGRDRTGTKVDVWTEEATTHVDGSGYFFGTWQNEHPGLGQSFGTKGLGQGKNQTTSVFVPGFGKSYPATIAEVNDGITCTMPNGELFSVAGFGLAVDLEMANGKPVSPYLEVWMTYNNTGVEGRSPGQIRVVHVDDDGNCWFPSQNCRVNTGFCYDVSTSGGGANKLTIVYLQLPHNGRAKNF
jgi:hypothetical protein